MTFPEYEWGIRCNSQIVDQCIGSCLACRQTRIISKLAKFHAHDCWLIQPNASKVSRRIIVILAAKAKFPTTANSKSDHIGYKCDIDGQPEIAIWLPKPEVLASSTDVKITTANSGFRGRQARREYPWGILIMISIDLHATWNGCRNRKYLYF